MKPPGAGYHDNEDRLERLFDRSHQLEMEEKSVTTATGEGVRETDKSLQSKMAAARSGGGESEGEGEEESAIAYEGNKDVSCIMYTIKINWQLSFYKLFCLTA